MKLFSFASGRRSKHPALFRVVWAGLCLLPLLVSAQHADSLISRLPGMKEDTNKIFLLERINYENRLNAAPGKTQYIRQQLALSEKLHYPRGVASAYVYMALFYESLHKFDLSLAYTLQADSIYRSLGHKNGLMETSSALANHYKRIGKYEEALAKYFEMLDYYEAIQFKPGMATTNGSLALLFIRMERYDEAEEYYLKSIRIREELGDERGISLALLNLGASFYDQKRYDKSLVYLKKCLEIQEKLNDPLILAPCLLNIGNIYNEQENYSQALSLFRKSRDIYHALGDTVMVAYTFLSESSTFHKWGQQQLSLQVLDTAFALVLHSAPTDAMLADFYNQYYLTFKAMGKYSQALHAYETSMRYRQDHASEQTANRISELKEKYETEKKEKENLALRQESEIKDLKLSRQWYLLYAAIGMAALIIIIFLQRLRNSKIRHKQRTVQLEQQLLRSQMNPHFIFNALISIQSFMYKKEPEEAGIYLSSFARLMRSILENSRDEYITFSKEVSWLRNYIELQKMRYEDAFDYVLEIDPAIEQENLLIPPMLSQPFIENALEHGLSQAGHRGQLDIRFRQENDFLYVEVTDNGVGFTAPASAVSADHASLAIKITRERIGLLNRRKNRKIQFTIESEPGKGTRVSFSIPVILKT